MKLPLLERPLPLQFDEVRYPIMAKPRNGLVKTVTVGAILGGLGLAVNTGLCVPPWNVQSTALATTQHEKINGRVDALGRNLHTLNHNLLKLGVKVGANDLKELEHE